MPDGAPAKVAIISQALVRLGESPISDLSSTIPGAVVGSTLYDDIVRAQLTKHNWRFAMRYIAADPLATKERNLEPDFDFEYILPAKHLRVIGLSETKQWALFQDRLYTSFSSINILYIDTIDESIWAPMFADALKVQLAYEMCTAIRDDQSLMDRLLGEARRNWAVARVWDSRQAISENVEDILRVMTNSPSASRW